MMQISMRILIRYVGILDPHKPKTRTMIPQFKWMKKSLLYVARYVIARLVRAGPE